MGYLLWGGVVQRGWVLGLGLVLGLELELQWLVLDLLRQQTRLGRVWGLVLVWGESGLGLQQLEQRMQMSGLW